MMGRFTIVAVVLAMSSQADSLRLRNGSIVNGSFLGGTADDVRFMVGDNVQHYARTDVAEIVFGSINAPSTRPVYADCQCGLNTVACEVLLPLPGCATSSSCSFM